jgi:hypothetical protein
MDINSDLSNICTPTHTSMGVPYMMAEQSDHNLARKQSPDVTNKHSLLHRHHERAARQMTVAQAAFLTHALPVLSLGVPAGMQPFLACSLSCQSSAKVKGHACLSLLVVTATACS